MGGATQLSSNDQIRLSSTFHGIIAIDADTFRLQCFHTPTGMKFFAIVLPPLQDCEPLLKQTYGLYSDYVLKNPFYELDMPVRCELFDREVKRLFGEQGLGAA